MANIGPWELELRTPPCYCRPMGNWIACFMSFESLLLEDKQFASISVFISTLFLFDRYQENKLRVQRSMALRILPKGNVCGKRAAHEIKVDHTPLP